MAGLLRTIRRAALQVQRLASALEVPGAENRVEKRTDFSNCPRPVLLLHGWFSARRTFEVLEERIYARHPGLGPLTIVGHSKGGLIAAYYVKKLGGWRRTRAVVTLGTPHRGTPTAWFGLPFALVARSLVQMIPGSPFLARLHDGPWPAQVRLVSIWSRQDGASPYPSCVIDTHGLPQLANVEVEGDHRAHLVRKRTYEVILREVRAAEAEAPVVKGPLTGMAGGSSKPARAAVAARTAGTGAA